MNKRYECEGCGIAGCDLPDGVDRDEFFTMANNKELCVGCAHGSGTYEFRMES